MLILTCVCVFIQGVALAGFAFFWPNNSFFNISKDAETPEIYDAAEAGTEGI